MSAGMHAINLRTSSRKLGRSEFSLNQIDLNLLRVFDIIMQERSVTKAAARLGRTQSAVSHALAKLREAFEDELFTREAGLMEPTPWAQELDVVISKSLADIRLVVDRHLNFELRQSSRSFRVGVTDYTAVSLLPRLVDEFARHAPHANLHVIHVDESGVLAALKTRQVDCAVLVNVSLREHSLGVIEISKDKMVCAGWRGNALLDDLTIENYLEAPHLAIAGDNLSYGAGDLELSRGGLRKRVVATVPNHSAAPWILKGSQLITVFGNGFLPAICEGSETKIVVPPFSLPELTVSMVFDRVSQDDLAHRWFRGFVKSVADTQISEKEAIYGRLGLNNSA